MRPLAQPVEPGDFDELVRQAGAAWLPANGYPTHGPNPHRKQPSPFWGRTTGCRDWLADAFGHRCTYSDFEIPDGVSDGHVDHFIPLKVDMTWAYEWANFRWSLPTVNRRKLDSVVPVDPCAMSYPMFHINLVTGRIRPHPGLSAIQAHAVAETIDTLGLDRPAFQDRRKKIIARYNRTNDAQGLRDDLPILADQLGV